LKTSGGPIGNKKFMEELWSIIAPSSEILSMVDTSVMGSSLSSKMRNIFLDAISTTKISRSDLNQAFFGPNSLYSIVSSHFGLSEALASLVNGATEGPKVDGDYGASATNTGRKISYQLALVEIEEVIGTPDFQTLLYWITLIII
jgi:hypothetical protein